MKNTSYRIGFTSVTFRDRSCEQICELAKKNGVKYIEWGADVHATDPIAARDIRSLCDRYDIETVSLGSYYRVGDRGFSDFKKDCESARILGAGRIRVWLGRQSAGDISADRRAELLDETRKLADIAREYGLTVAFEFHKKTLTDNADAARLFIEECGAENVRSYWQPFFCGNDEDNLAKILPHVDAVHVFSWDADNTRFPLAEKEKEWLSFLRIIGTSKRQIDLILEFVKNDDALVFASDVQTLRSWIEA